MGFRACYIKGLRFGFSPAGAPLTLVCQLSSVQLSSSWKAERKDGGPVVGVMLHINNQVPQRRHVKCLLLS